MKGMNLFYGMNYVDDVYILEAWKWKKTKKEFNSIFLVCSVAAAVVIACALIMSAFFRSEFQKDRPLEDVPTLNETEVQTVENTAPAVDTAYRYEVKLGWDGSMDSWSWNKEQGYLDIWEWLETQGYVDTREVIEGYYLERGYEKLDEFRYSLYDYPGKYLGIDLTFSSVRINRGRRGYAYTQIIGNYNRIASELTQMPLISRNYQDVFLRNVFQEKELPGCSPEEAREYCDPVVKQFGAEYEYVDVYVLDYETIEQMSKIEELKEWFVAPDFDDLEGWRGTWTADDSAYLLIYRGQQFEDMPLIYGNIWGETFAIFSPTQGLIYFNVNRELEDVMQQEKVVVVPIEDATEEFYNLAEEYYGMQQDTIEITGYELVYALDFTEGPEYKKYLSPYWKISFEPKTTIKDWMPFSEQHGLLKEEYRGSDAYLLVEASGGLYVEEKEKYYVYQIENEKIDEAEFRLWLEESGYILPEATIREMGYQIGEDLYGDEQTAYRDMLAVICDNEVLIKKNDLYAAYTTSNILSDEASLFRMQDFYLRKLFPEETIEGYPVSEAEKQFLPILEKLKIEYEVVDIYVMAPEVMQKCMEIRTGNGGTAILPEYDPVMHTGGREWQEEDIAYMFVYRGQEVDGKAVMERDAASQNCTAQVIYSPQHGLIYLKAHTPVNEVKKKQVSVISEEEAFESAKRSISLEEDVYSITGAELVYAQGDTAFEYDGKWNLIKRDTYAPYWKIEIEPVNGIEEWLPVEAELLSRSLDVDSRKAHVLIPATE